MMKYVFCKCGILKLGNNCLDTNGISAIKKELKLTQI